MSKVFKKISLFYRAENDKALLWEKRLREIVTAHGAVVDDHDPEAVIVLGGDGTILEAARKYDESNPVLLGLNLGTVGFLASVRDENRFLDATSSFLKGDYGLTERMMLSSEVWRDGQLVAKACSLNEVNLQNLLSMVEVAVDVDGYNMQKVQGTGVLVATSTGSTAYNLSAHGPIVMPDINCMIITELLDHGIPTPSLVVTPNKEISLHVVDFREHGLLTVTSTKKTADVLLLSDGEIVCALEKGDTVLISKSRRTARFAEMEGNYFLKSLHERFAYR